MHRIGGRLGSVNSTVAAILHDVMRIAVKEQPDTVDELTRTVKAEFGEQVLGIIVGLCKISNIKLKVSKEQADDFRDMIVSYSEDPRVILIKLADRLEVMRNLDIFPPEKRRKKSWESLNLYAQIAHKLGLYALKSELEDLALKWLENKDYEYICRRLEETESERQTFIARSIAQKRNVISLLRRLRHHLGLVGLRTPGITGAPGMKMKSFARRSDSPMKIEPSAAVAIASN